MLGLTSKTTQHNRTFFLRDYAIVHKTIHKTPFTTLSLLRRFKTSHYIKTKQTLKQGLYKLPNLPPIPTYSYVFIFNVYMYLLTLLFLIQNCHSLYNMICCIYFLFCFILCNKRLKTNISF